jgi:hypothetical protein
MLKDRSDEFYGARLVADARLHLGAIMNGQYSEPFFVTMCKIISQEVYLGYKNFSGKQVKLSGIKDFLYSFHHGLGLKASTIDLFCLNCTKLALKDRSQSKYAFRFVDWLKKQDEKFVFPEEVFELRKIYAQISLEQRTDRKEKWRQLSLAKKIYSTNSELLSGIGAGKKYKNVVDCAEALGLLKKPRLIRQNLYNNPTERNLFLLAKQLSRILAPRERRCLIANMIEIYKAEQGENVDQPA